MKKISMYIIGFRSGNIKRKFAAIIYFMFTCIGFSSDIKNGISFFLMFNALPYVLIGFIDFIKYREVKRLIFTFAGSIILSLSILIMPKNYPAQAVNHTEPIAYSPDTVSEDNSLLTSINTVWITDTGAKYHKETCGALRGNKRAISLNEAELQGKLPCKKCFK